MSPPPASSHAQSDLDSTAELPVLDPAGAAVPAADEAQHTRTDTWVMPPGERKLPSGVDADSVRQMEANLQSTSAALQSVSQELHEAQELLAGRGERVAQLERARDEAQATLAAADRRAAVLEQRLAALNAELSQRQAGEGQHAAQFDEARQTRLAAEERAAAAEQELARMRPLLSSAGERAAELQRRLEQHESEHRAQRDQQLEQQQALVIQGRAHAAGMMEDLHSERARAMSYLESLQSLEGRRLIAENLITELQHEAEAREADLARLARELTSHNGRERELNAELEQRAARITRLEQQVSSSAAMLEQRDSQVRDARTQAEGLQASVTRLQAEITSADERRQALEGQLEQNHDAVSQQLAELQRLRAERGELNTALESARSAATTAAEAATARVTLQDGLIAQQRAQTAQLEAALAAERHRTAELESELTTLRTEMEDWGGVLRSAQQERGDHLARITAAEARVQALEHQAAEHRQSLITLQAERDAQAARAGELDAGVRAAREIAQRVEAEAAERNARILELEKSNQQWRTTAEETRHVLAETASNPALRDATRQLADDGAAEAPPDGATRLLIQSESGREIVHVLGRKTSIGRTPDNDLQIEAKFVSRHHAVILAGPAQTIIEDLNSTNGVQVNGRRITRHTLRDGDQIAIGRAQYRFAVRKGDRR